MKLFFLKITIVSIIVLPGYSSFSQQIVSSSGNKLNGSSASINFTLGETVTGSFSTLSLGFHQALSPTLYNISGTIYKNDYNTEITEGEVYLINYDTAAGQLSFADSILLNGTAGINSFYNHTAGNYLILIRPDEGK